MTTNKKNLIGVLPLEEVLTLSIEEKQKTHQLHFHYMWLRHHCPCCIHPVTKERIVSPALTAQKIQPFSVNMKNLENTSFFKISSKMVEN